MAKRTTEDSWKAARWFGSIESLATAAEVAASELGEIDGGWDAGGAEVDDGNPHCSARVRYGGGTFNADDMEELRAEVPALERIGLDKIESVSLSVLTPRYSATISASDGRGVEASVGGPSATVVHGLVSTLQRKLDLGVGRVREQPLLPRTWDHWGALVLGWLFGLILGFLVVRSADEYGWDWIYVLFLLMASVGPLMGTAYFYDRIRPAPEALELVPEVDEAKPPPEPDRRGPILQGRDWLRRHPILTLLGVIIIGVASNLVSNAIGA